MIGKSEDTEQMLVEHTEETRSKSRNEILRSLTESFENHGLHQEFVGVVDTTLLPVEDVIALFDELAEQDMFVMHGSNSPEPYANLRANQSFDTVRESGNERAVYAATSPLSVLSRAVLNKRYLNSIGGYSLGEVFDEHGRKVFKVDPKTYQMIVNKNSEVFSDGYVYLLPKSKFEPSPDDAKEFFAVEDQVPLVALKVSGNLGSHIFVTGQGEDADTLSSYTDIEMAETDANIRKRQRQLNDRQKATQVVNSVLSPEDVEINGAEVATRLRELGEFSPEDSLIEKMLLEIERLPALSRDRLVEEIVRISGELSETQT